MLQKDELTLSKGLDQITMYFLEYCYLRSLFLHDFSLVDIDLCLFSLGSVVGNVFITIPSTTVNIHKAKLLL